MKKDKGMENDYMYVYIYTYIWCRSENPNLKENSRFGGGGACRV